MDGMNILNQRLTSHNFWILLAVSTQLLESFIKGIDIPNKYPPDMFKVFF